MKLVKTFISLLFITLLSSPSWSEILSIDDLVERNDLNHKKCTNAPFNGQVMGKEDSYGRYFRGAKT